MKGGSARARQAGDVGDTTAFAPLEPKLKLLADDLTWWAVALAAAPTRPIAGPLSSS